MKTAVSPTAVFLCHYRIHFALLSVIQSTAQPFSVISIIGDREAQLRSKLEINEVKSNNYVLNTSIFKNPSNLFPMTLLILTIR